MIGNLQGTHNIYKTPYLLKEPEDEHRVQVGPVESPTCIESFRFS